MARGPDDTTVDTDPRPDDCESGREAEKSRINRRNCLRYGLSAVMGAAGASKAGRVRGSTPRTRHGVRFDRVVNAVNDLGADPTGRRAMDGVLHRALETGTLVEFPPGEYLVTDGIRVIDTDRVGMRGLGLAPNDVRLRPVSSADRDPTQDGGPAIVVAGGDGVLLENFQAGNRRPPARGVNIIAQSGDVLEVHGIRQPEAWTVDGDSGIGIPTEDQLREMRAHALGPGRAESSNPPTTGRTLTVSSIETPAVYAVGVTGDLISLGTNGGRTTVSGGEIATRLSDTTTRDTYRFTGDIVSFEVIEGAVQPEIDGRAYVPTDLGYPRSLTIEGHEGERTATYELAVSGSLSARPGEGVITLDDVSEVQTVEGSVATRAHRYRFTGAVTFIDVRGPATVLVDGEPIDPESGRVDPPSLGQRIIVEGDGTEGTASYEFSVAGEAQRGQGISPQETFDSVTEAGVTGTVSDGTGCYRVSGALETLSVEGGATVSLGTTNR